jgi:hypothetical protein
MLVAAPPGIVKLGAVVVANVREEAAVEEGAGASELGSLVAIAEAVNGVAHVERHVELVAGLERLVERVGALLR